MYRSTAFAASLCAFAALAQAAAPLPLEARIDAAVAPYFKADAPGGVVIVVKDRQVIYRKGFGLADVANAVPMKGGEQHRIGSLTKQFTATAILLLEQDGKLALSDRLSAYLPGYPAHGRDITIEHLLTHTAGLPNYTSKPGFRALLNKDLAVHEVIDTFKDDPLEFAPGSKHAYSNSGYVLLGAVIEKVSGMSYAQFVERRIFSPLGMKDTAYDGHARGAAPRAVAHSTTPGGFRLATHMSMTLPYAAGALVSTADDLARWNDAIVEGKLLKPANWQRAFTPSKLTHGESTGYGYGWRIDTLQGRLRIWHGGGAPGHSAHALRLPEEKLFVAVLVNNDRHSESTGVIANRAAAAALGND